MSYKILLIGNNKVIINDFFLHMRSEFDCMTSSTRYEDVVNHIKYIKPDAIVYCLYKETRDSIRQFYNAEERITYEDLPLVVIGDSWDCEEFEKYTPQLKPLVLKKPIANQTVMHSISLYIDDWKNKNNVEEISDPNVGAEEMSAYIVSEAEAVEEEPEEEVIEVKKKHILIVDDDVNVLKMIKGILSEEYDVATAISGKIALKFLETKSTDLILLDYEMPGENGAEVLAKIKATRKLANIPVLFLTGVTNREKISEVLALKPQGYLLKPISTSKLKNTIKSLWT